MFFLNLFNYNLLGNKHIYQNLTYPKFQLEDYNLGMDFFSCSGWNIFMAFPRQFDFIFPGLQGFSGIILLYHELILIGTFIIVVLFFLLIVILSKYSIGGKMSFNILNKNKDNISFSFFRGFFEYEHSFIPAMYSFTTHPYSYDFLIAYNNEKECGSKWASIFQGGGILKKHLIYLEIIWTLIPGFILFLIAIPSFNLIFFQGNYVSSVGLGGLPSLSVKVTGNQWFWEYSYSGETFLTFLRSHILKNCDLDSGVIFVENVNDPFFNFLELSEDTSLTFDYMIKGHKLDLELKRIGFGPYSNLEEERMYGVEELYFIDKFSQVDGIHLINLFMDLFKSEIVSYLVNLENGDILELWYIGAFLSDPLYKDVDIKYAQDYFMDGVLRGSYEAYKGFNEDYLNAGSGRYSIIFIPWIDNLDFFSENLSNFLIMYNFWIPGFNHSTLLETGWSSDVFSNFIPLGSKHLLYKHLKENFYFSKLYESGGSKSEYFKYNWKWLLGYLNSLIFWDFFENPDFSSVNGTFGPYDEGSCESSSLHLGTFNSNYASIPDPVNSIRYIESSSLDTADHSLRFRAISTVMPQYSEALKWYSFWKGSWFKVVQGYYSGFGTKRSLNTKAAPEFFGHGFLDKFGFQISLKTYDFNDLYYGFTGIKDDNPLSDPFPNSFFLQDNDALIDFLIEFVGGINSNANLGYNLYDYINVFKNSFGFSGKGIGFTFTDWLAGCIVPDHYFLEGVYGENNGFDMDIMDNHLHYDEKLFGEESITGNFLMYKPKVFSIINKLPDNLKKLYINNIFESFADLADDYEGNLSTRYVYNSLEFPEKKKLEEEIFSKKKKKKKKKKRIRGAFAGLRELEKQYFMENEVQDGLDFEEKFNLIKKEDNDGFNSFIININENAGYVLRDVNKVNEKKNIKEPYFDDKSYELEYGDGLSYLDYGQLFCFFDYDVNYLYDLFPGFGEKDIRGLVSFNSNDYGNHHKLMPSIFSYWKHTALYFEIIGAKFFQKLGIITTPEEFRDFFFINKTLDFCTGELSFLFFNLEGRFNRKKMAKGSNEFFIKGFLGYSHTLGFIGEFGRKVPLVNTGEILPILGKITDFRFEILPGGDLTILKQGDYTFNTDVDPTAYTDSGHISSNFIFFDNFSNKVGIKQENELNLFGYSGHHSLYESFEGTTKIFPGMYEKLLEMQLLAYLYSLGHGIGSHWGHLEGYYIDDDYTVSEWRMTRMGAGSRSARNVMHGFYKHVSYGNDNFFDVFYHFWGGFLCLSLRSLNKYLIFDLHREHSESVTFGSLTVFSLRNIKLMQLSFEDFLRRGKFSDLIFIKKSVRECFEAGITSFYTLNYVGFGNLLCFGSMKNLELTDRFSDPFEPKTEGERLMCEDISYEGLKNYKYNMAAGVFGSFFGSGQLYNYFSKEEFSDEGDEEMEPAFRWLFCGFFFSRVHDYLYSNHSYLDITDNLFYNWISPVLDTVLETKNLESVKNNWTRRIEFRGYEIGIPTFLLMSTGGSRNIDIDFNATKPDFKGGGLSVQRLYLPPSDLAAFFNLNESCKYKVSRYWENFRNAEYNYWFNGSQINHNDSFIFNIDRFIKNSCGSYSFLLKDKLGEVVSHKLFFERGLEDLVYISKFSAFNNFHHEGHNEDINFGFPNDFPVFELSKEKNSEKDMIFWEYVLRDYCSICEGNFNLVNYSLMFEKGVTDFIDLTKGNKLSMMISGCFDIDFGPENNGIYVSYGDSLEVIPGHFVLVDYDTFGETPYMFTYSVKNGARLNDEENLSDYLVAQFIGSVFPRMDDKIINNKNTVYEDNSRITYFNNIFFRVYYLSFYELLNSYINELLELIFLAHKFFERGVKFGYISEKDKLDEYNTFIDSIDFNIKVFTLFFHNYFSYTDNLVSFKNDIVCNIENLFKPVDVAFLKKSKGPKITSIVEYEKWAKQEALLKKSDEEIIGLVGKRVVGATIPAMITPFSSIGTGFYTFEPPISLSDKYSYNLEKRLFFFSRLFNFVSNILIHDNVVVGVDKLGVLDRVKRLLFRTDFYHNNDYNKKLYVKDFFEVNAVNLNRYGREIAVGNKGSFNEMSFVYHGIISSLLVAYVDLFDRGSILCDNLKYVYRIELKKNIEYNLMSNFYGLGKDFNYFFKFKYVSGMVPGSDNGNIFALDVTRSLYAPSLSNIGYLVTSADVIHSFAIPALGLKIDANPGRINEVFSGPALAGIYPGQCSEICGVDHSFMPAQVKIVTGVFGFSAWLFNAGLSIDS